MDSNFLYRIMALILEFRRCEIKMKLALGLPRRKKKGETIKDYRLTSKGKMNLDQVVNKLRHFTN